MQMIGVYVLVPVMMAGAVTTEKTTGSLPLLILTAMRPSQIVWQKLLSGMVPVVLLLLASGPLMAVCYSWGGVEMIEIWQLLYLLIISALQLGAVALMCSAFASTTVGALLATYAIMATPLVVLGLTSGLLGIRFVVGTEFIFRLIPAMNYAVSAGLLSLTLDWSWLTWLTIIIAMLFAQRFLITRADAKPRNILRLFFQWIDRLFTKLNPFVRHQTLNNADPSLPANHPVAWRETHRAAVNSTRNQIRLILCLFIPSVLFASIILDTLKSWDLRDTLIVAKLAAWFGAAFMLIVFASGLFTSERSAQTYEILMTTPLTGREILNQKLAAILRLRWIMAVPIAVLGVAQAYTIHQDVGWWGMGQSNYGISNQSISPAPSTLFYLVALLTLIAIHIRLLTWITVWVSLKTPSRVQAIVATLLFVALICMLPILGVGAIYELADWRQDSASWFYMNLSPITFVIMLEDGFHPRFPDPLTMFLLNCILFGALTATLRWYCLTRADKLLGRVRPNTTTTVSSNTNATQQTGFAT